MITTMMLENVRLFDKRLDLTCKAITVLCGTNSAGKSTALKVPILLRQSLGIGEAYELHSGLLRPVGGQVDFGSFTTMVSHGDVLEDVVLGLTCDVGLPDRQVRLLRALRLTGDELTVTGGGSQQIPCSLSVRFRFGQLEETTSKGQKTRAAFEGAGFLKHASFEVSATPTDPLLQWSVARIPQPAHEEIQTVRYECRIPTNYFRYAGGFDVLDLQEGEFDEWVSLEAVMSGILPIGLFVPLRVRRPRKKSVRKKATLSRTRYGTYPLPPTIMQLTQAFSAILEHVHYLGPLRSSPQRYYVAGVSRGLDSSGAFLPFILRDKQDAEVVYARPRSESVREASLATAVAEWLGYLRTGTPETMSRADDARSELEVSTTKRVLVELRVRGLVGDERYALADSGFGFSQVLPILVRGLLASPGSTLIVEQPELHLNPSLQVRLAEFFVAIARAGKQIIVETHSEHMVDSLRALTAEAATRTPQSSIIYFDVDENGPRTVALEVQADGSVTEWPVSFFGEAAALRGRILRAQSRGTKSE